MKIRDGFQSVSPKVNPLLDNQKKTKKTNNFSPKKIQKVLMKVEEMADVFLN